MPYKRGVFSKPLDRPWCIGIKVRGRRFRALADEIQDAIDSFVAEPTSAQLGLQRGSALFYTVMAIHDHAGRRHLVQRQAVDVVPPAAERTTGIGPGAAVRHVEGRGTGATFKVTFTGAANINIDDASVSLTASGSGLLPRARQVSERSPLVRLC
jgi:hypothetical protein